MTRSSTGLDSYSFASLVGDKDLLIEHDALVGEPAAMSDVTEQVLSKHQFPQHSALYFLPSGRRGQGGTFNGRADRAGREGAAEQVRLVQRPFCLCESIPFSFVLAPLVGHLACVTGWFMLRAIRNWPIGSHGSWRCPLPHKAVARHRPGGHQLNTFLSARPQPGPRCRCSRIGPG